MGILLVMFFQSELLVILSLETADKYLVVLTNIRPYFEFQCLELFVVKLHMNPWPSCLLVFELPSSRYELFREWTAKGCSPEMRFGPFYVLALYAVFWCSV